MSIGDHLMTPSLTILFKWPGHARAGLVGHGNHAQSISLPSSLGCFQVINSYRAFPSSYSVFVTLLTKSNRPWSVVSGQWSWDR